MNNTHHLPVLYHEIIHALRPHASGRYVDGTVGAGGHARGILEACAPDGELLGLDLDPQALALARETLAPFGPRAHLAQASYTAIPDQLRRLGWDAADGIVLDLGLSSMQLDAPERGFSFQRDAPLDMRFSPANPVTAAALVNTLDEAELADLLFRFGEESDGRRIARAIVRARPLQTTRQLAAVVERAVPRRKGIHPATRTFQALRIAVNEELAAVTEALPKAAAALRSGGRLAVISFHSLEDRIVKDFFREQSRDLVNPPYTPIYKEERKAVLKEISRKPIVPSEAEIESNPRARSAKLRIAEKL
ncbi:MAG TPA: 16S rRNA (cytosine(1402)-N(4))-methyltransferase RsmH [Anaerolineales bacterium]|nr:16S rRNA (cytosine(1402)-N(4))-methyltransferase RsmH [Anaerolineae bacterium]MBL1171229.1 16S rRNA (cytosine(1402)-N(4))-methyltransferase RsmH [Chloroflexota bacterium]MDL1925524.1 16S rRNA (cytosine(1402)-N(4))-methyltransferase RsmH [Anaerolineae bacterium AMX1]WKZ54738.1 MAG: 16S rRNA (cytosine(1402)-N(4))-methyltransferase RsmH [Anaerolineales bacterium]NOG74686.1 16S rRNA (cytosine(1402)-N(4))-methyltransferase RsmH [Chloroflexota bacterium]